MDRGLDAAIGIVHVKCVRPMCASPKYVSTLLHARGRCRKEWGGGGRGKGGGERGGG